MTETQHSLAGLEPDNLLAFLALLGLLRALETVRPVWRPRVTWRGTPPVAALHLDHAADRDQILTALNEGIRALAAAYAFDRKDIKYEASEFRRFAKDARDEPGRARLFAAIASDGALKRNSEEVAATPLCAMFGQGHQSFLARLTSVVSDPDPAGPDKLRETLFEPWRYGDETESFRWDPVEDRRYALQFGNPSEGRNKIGTVTGANRLAAIGFARVTTVPTARGLTSLGVARAGSEQDVCWPIVAAPTSLAGYIALLTHPALGDEEKAPDLAAYGVCAVARARRFQNEKYFNFERARVQILPGEITPRS